jgi:hypothetical protein
MEKEPTRMTKFLKRLFRLKPITILSAATLAVFSSVSPNARDWISSNVSFLQKWEEDTKMPSGVLIFFGVIIIGSFIYQLIDAFKESDTEKIEKKLDKVITMLEQKNNSILGGEQNAGNQSNPTEPKRTHSDKPRKRNKH